MIDVTCAVIRNEEDDILIVQRGEISDHPFKWEFPGGKLKTGESEEECVIREVREELSMDIIICRRLDDVEYDYGHKSIRLIPFVCDTLDELPFLSEHIAFRWVSPEKLKDTDFSEADVFVARQYIENLSERHHKETIRQAEAGTINEDEIREMIDKIMGMKEAEWAASSVVENPALLRKFVEFSFSSDRKLAFHASWILTKACDKSPEIIYPFIPQIVESLSSIDNESALRSFLRILSFCEPVRLDKKHHGLLADECFRQLNSGFSAIAVKAYSMEILYRLTLIYPELATELALSVRGLIDIDSAGIVSKAKTILRKLNK